MKNLKFLFILLLLVGIFNANVGNFNPQNVESINVLITRSGTIISETGMFSNMDLTLSVPQNTYYQVVEISGIDNGNIIKVGESDVLNFKRRDTINSFTYSYTSNITTERRTINYPLNYNGGKESFLEETEHVLINEEIQNKAEKVISRASNDLEKIALLAIWVNEEMEYDIREVGKNHDSIKVYENRKGVCVEYTNLFLAMVRAIGIPGRAVTGYVYSPDYGWQLHSWAEVYLDKWVGVDPTWLEVGTIDATHIPLHFDHNTILRESVTASVHSREPLKWIGRGTLGGAASGINIIWVETDVPKYEIVRAPYEKINVGSEGTILFEIEVDYFTVFQANINSCRYETEIITLEENKITYFLTPGKNYVPINFKVSEMINPNNNYFCPITISHTYGYDEVNIDIQGRKTVPSFDVYFSNIDEEKVSFKIYSSDGVPVNVLTNKEKNMYEINRNTMSNEISVSSKGINKKNLVFYNQNTVKFYDLENLDIGTKEIILRSISFPENVPNDEKSYMEFDFGFNNGDEMTIMYYINGVLISTEKTMEREYKFKKEIDTTRIGVQNVVIKIKSYSEEFVYENSYRVYKPEIKYNVRKINENEYEFMVEGPYEEYTIYVNEQRLLGNITELEKGDNEIKIIWTDLNGNRREHVSNYNTEGFLQILGIVGIVITLFIIYFFRNNIMRLFKWK